MLQQNIFGGKNYLQKLINYRIDDTVEKQKIVISLQEQSEWLHFFNAQKNKAESLQSAISQTDITINNLVYELYQLNEEERGILNLTNDMK